MSLISKRNTFLGYITDTDFPDDISILSFALSVNDSTKTTVTCATAHNLSNGDKIVIPDTDNYNGNFSITDSDGNTKFDIDRTYTSTETGTIKGHKYKYLNEQINTFPAVVVEAARQNNFNGSLSSRVDSYTLNMYVIDRLDTYGDERDVDSLDSAMIAMIDKFQSILDTINSNRSIAYQNTFIEPVRHDINDKKVIIIQGDIILNR